jgi:RHS repeat-associated protein
VTPVEPWQPDTTYRIRLDGATDDRQQPVGTIAWAFTTVGASERSDRLRTSDGGWTPDATSLERGWRTGRPPSPWESLPLLQAAPGQTALAGRVLRLDGQPLAGVQLEMEGREARSDATGRFLLRLPAGTQGRHECFIDGRRASRAHQVYGTFEAGLYITPGRTNPLTFTIWMPRLDTDHVVRIPSPTTHETIITTPRIPGLELRLPAGTVIRDHDGRIVREVGITAIPLDRPPFPLPKQVDVPIYFTAQPGAAYVYASGNQRARVIYPNYRHEPPGRHMAFWHYDPEERGWYVYGEGAVSPNGQQIVPDAGVGIYEFTGAMVAPPSLAPLIWPTDTPSDGDPVNLGTGLLVVEKTDLALPDVLPLEFTRTYRSLDTRSRAFGMGATHAFDVFLVGDTSPYTYVDLVLPDGHRLHYARVSPGTGPYDAVYEHTTSPTPFFKSRIAWNGNAGGWNLTLKDGSVWTFPDGAGAPRSQLAALLQIRDRHGNRLMCTRSNGDLVRVTSPNGRWIAFTYDTSHRVTQVTDIAGRTVTYTYDGSGRLWKVTDVLGGVTEYTYDATHRLLTIKDPRNTVYLTNEYDTNGRVSRQTLADATTYQFAYTLDTWGDVTQADVTNPRGIVRRVAFNADGYAVSNTTALGRPEEQVTTAERQTGTGFVTAVVDPLSRRTEWGYDTLGHVTSVTNLAGTANAATTTATYASTFGLLTSLTDPLGHAASFTYSALAGDLVDVRDPLQHHTTLSYNGAGQPLSATDALGHTTTFTYALGDLSSVTTPLLHTWKQWVDVAGRPIAVTDPLGRSTSIEYDALDQVTRTIDPQGGETSHTYDPNGNPLSLTDAKGHTTSYTYDVMDRLATRTDPLSRQATYHYDDTGNLREVIDRKGQVTTVTFDGLNRPTGVTYADASTAAYTWDGGNRLRQVADSVGGTVTATYDDRDNLTNETTPQGAITYAYDAVGRRTAMTVAGQPTVSYGYDDADRLTSLTRGTAAVAVSYDHADRPTSLTLPNGIVMSYAYDVDAQLTGITYTWGGGTMGALTYGYDDAGQRTATGGSYARTTLPAALAPASYDAANQLTQWGGATRTHDANGNLLSDGARTFTWNARNELVGVAGAASAGFAYDAWGRRAARTLGASTTDFLSDGLNVVQELSAGVPTANLLVGLGLDQSFARIEPTTQQSIVTDALGSAIAVANDAGVVQAEYTYAPFGETTTVGASANAAQFTGRENDATGLYYYRARYYDPHSQRFLSEDPLGFGGGDVNLYAYVQNRPTQLTDPLGLLPFSMPGCRPGGKSSSGWKGFLHDRRCSPDVPFFGPLGMAGAGAEAAAGAAAAGARAGAGAAAKGAAAAARAAKRWRGFRQALGRLAGETPAGADAHHNLPIEFYDRFMEMGLNPNDPMFGSFWERGSHMATAYEFNAAWRAWLSANGRAEAADALAFARQLAKQYGLTTYF